MPAQPQSATCPTSLVTTRETVDSRLCLRREFAVFYAVENPALWVFDSCRSYKCPVCGPRKARQIAHAMAWSADKAGRARFITLTNAPADTPRRLQKMKDLTRWARAHGWTYEMAWTTEAGSSTGMVHVHALQWGDYIPQPALQERWGAIVDIRAVRRSPGAVSQYMAKGAGAVGQYMAKGAGDDFVAWRDLNGGRPMRWSRGFFHGLGVRDAIKAAQGKSLDGSDYTWARCSVEGYRAQFGSLA